jgi:hypothetical protein
MSKEQSAWVEEIADATRVKLMMLHEQYERERLRIQNEGRAQIDRILES